MSENTSSVHVGLDEAKGFSDTYRKEGAGTAHVLAASGKAAIKMAASKKPEGEALPTCPLGLLFPLSAFSLFW